MHSFKSHFSLPFDRYNNRPTAHAYERFKGLLLLSPNLRACLVFTGDWVVCNRAVTNPPKVQKL